MKYAALLTNHADAVAAWEAMSPEEAAAARAEEVPKWEALFGELGASGALGAGYELDSPKTARTVRVRDGETLVTDGPFADTKEQIGGLMEIEAEDLDAAIAIAARIPVVFRAVRRAEAGHRALTTDVGRVFREEWGRAVAALTRVLGDIQLAEDAVQDAFTTALERWPRDGTPANPGAWIITAARNRAIDRLRREQTFVRKAELLARLEALPAEEDDVSSIPDDRLALVFTCCHPALAAESRVALTLREVAGLTTTEIAHAFLVAEPAMAQRLVRAKKKVRRRRHPLPRPARPPAAGAAALRARGPLPRLQRGLLRQRRRRADPGRALRRGDPAGEAARGADAGRAGGARAAGADAPARRAPRGAARRRRRDRPPRRSGSQPLEPGRGSTKARACSSARSRTGAPAPTRCRRRSRRSTSRNRADWPQIAALYAELARLEPSPIVELNRAVAVAMADGPERGLELVERIDLPGLPPAPRRTRGLPPPARAPRRGGLRLPRRARARDERGRPGVPGTAPGRGGTFVTCIASACPSSTAASS